MRGIFNKPSIINRLMKAEMVDCAACSEEETQELLQQKAQGKALPDDIILYKDKAYKIDPEEFSVENEMHLLSVSQTLYLKSINGWLTFFGVLTILGLIGGLITIIAVFA